LNNAIYGMTGGQMAPTTILGQRTTTCPLGRSPKRDGYPIRIAEMLATLEGATYIARVAVHNPRAIIAAKKALKKAFEFQINGLGFSLVEFLSPCPTGWGISPTEATKWVEENMIPTFPVGEFKVPKSEKLVK